MNKALKEKDRKRYHGENRGPFTHPDILFHPDPGRPLIDPIHLAIVSVMLLLYASTELCLRGFYGKNAWKFGKGGSRRLKNDLGSKQSQIDPLTTPA
eukprot:1138374-Pelagomonas_calceolata.AAC.4